LNPRPKAYESFALPLSYPASSRLATSYRNLLKQIASRSPQALLFPKFSLPSPDEKIWGPLFSFYQKSSLTESFKICHDFCVLYIVAFATTDQSEILQSGVPKFRNKNFIVEIWGKGQHFSRSGVFSVRRQTGKENMQRSEK
jgi:hypothetical protein